MLRDFSLEEFDIVIQAGQSNSEGCGVGEVTNPFIPDSDIFYMENDFTICEAHEYVSGNLIVGNFSLPFCIKYIIYRIWHLSTYIGSGFSKSYITYLTFMVFTLVQAL